MKNISVLIFIILSLISSNIFAQPPTQDPEFGQEIEKMLKYGISTITIKDFKKMLKNEKVVILDAREKHEYDISHIKGAKWLGHNSLNKAVLEKLDKNATIVVYCTVGIRADKVGSRLEKMGFKNVFNLLGSIVEWVNQGNVVIDSSNTPTKNVHAYREEYAKWLTGGTKVLEEE
jgi:rhodanese-related sulfurtransferase